MNQSGGILEESMNRQTGRVKNWNSERAFGFIIYEEKTKNGNSIQSSASSSSRSSASSSIKMSQIFFHINDLVPESNGMVRQPMQNDKVSFEVVETLKFDKLYTIKIDFTLKHLSIL